MNEIQFLAAESGNEMCRRRETNEASTILVTSTSIILVSRLDIFTAITDSKTSVDEGALPTSRNCG